MLCFLCRHGESILVDKRSTKKSSDVVHKFREIVHEFENGGSTSNTRDRFNDTLSPPVCQQCFSKLKSVTVSHLAVNKVEARVRKCQEELLLEMKNLQCSLDKLYMEMEAVGTIINCSKQRGITDDEDVIAADYRSQMLRAISSLVIFRNKLREKTGVSLEDTGQDFVDKNNQKIKSEPCSDYNTASDDEQPMEEFGLSADFRSLNSWKPDRTNEDNDEDNLVDPLSTVKAEEKPVPKPTTARNSRAKRKVTKSALIPKGKKSAPEGSTKRKNDSNDVNLDDPSRNENEDNKDFEGAPVYITSDDDDNVDETLSNASAEWNEGVNSLPTARITRSKNQFPPKTATSSSVAKKLTEFPCAFETCGEVFPNKISLRRHMFKSHPRSKKFRCSCGLYFLTYELRRVHREESDIHPEYQRKKLHLPQVKGPKPPKILQTCDLCGLKLTAAETFEHVRGHVGDYAMNCPVANCLKIYSTHIMLLHHIRNSRKCRRDIRAHEFYCETCAFKANKHSNLRIHVDRLHERDPQKSLKCPIASCDKSFCVRQGVQFHLASHLHSDATFQICEHCQKRIKTEEMGEHLKREHEAEELVTCQQCPYSFTSRTSLVEHIFVHRYTGMYCDICNDNVKYTRHTELREHYQTIHNVCGKQYVCEQCGLIFWKKPSWMCHIRLKHSMEVEETPKEKKRWPCDACFGKVDFCSEPGLIAHKISAHGDTPFTCTICGATFTNKVDFSRHQKEHAGIPIKKFFNCDVAGCGKVFINKNKLKNHHSFVHLGQRDYACDSCGKKFGSNHRLKRHLKLVHLGERAHICEVCGERFGNVSTLKSHLRIHTGERPFACEFCGQTFSQNAGLRRHLEAHEKKGTDFKPNGPMKRTRKRNTQ